MRLRLGITLATVFAVLLSPITPIAKAFSGYASAPQNVSVSTLVLGLRVTWSAPADIDSGITGYRVEYSTSGTSGNWTLAATTNGSTFTYDIGGLSVNPTYVRVAATTSSGTGLFGYPWTKLYGTTSMNRNGSNEIVYETGFGYQSGEPYQTLSGASFTRIRMRMDATISSTAYFAETDFYNWNAPGDVTKTTNQSASPSVQNLIIPSKGGSFNQTIHANVSDLNVYSNSSNVIKGNLSLGRLEIWPWDYGTGTSGLSPTNANGNYDWDDLPSAPSGGSYGSFQVHDLVNYRPVFVWNHHDNGVHPEIAFGPAPSGNPDWTFCSTLVCPKPTVFRVQIFVNVPTTPTADTTAPTVTRIDAKIIIKNGDTISVRSSEIGNVYLVKSTVSVINASSITGAASNLRNSVSISSAGVTTTLTTSGLLDGTYKLYAIDSSDNVSSPIANTLTMDSTAPAISSYAVNSDGSAITLTLGESVTLASFASGAYTVSDSGSALSISSASVSGLVVTLNLSRSVPANAYVTFAYTPSSVGAYGRWIDAAGNELAAIALRNITNNSSAPISVTLTVPDSVNKGSSVTITASVSVAGKVTFFIAGKRIPGCINKTAAGTTPISVSCTFKPALTASQVIKATLTPTITAYPATSAQATRFITKRTNIR